MAVRLSRDRKVAGSNPAAASSVPEVSVVDAQLRAPLGLSSLPVHSAECTGNRM